MSACFIAQCKNAFYLKINEGKRKKKKSNMFLLCLLELWKRLHNCLLEMYGPGESQGMHATTTWEFSIKS